MEELNEIILKSSLHTSWNTVSTKQKPIIYTQKIKTKESKHTTTEKSLNHKGREQEKKKGTIGVTCQLPDEQHGG